MSAKRWVIAFIFLCVSLMLFVAGMNIIVDPFGVFCDSLYDSFPINATNNPRVAKIEYLEAHPDKFDSFLIGGSSTSSYPVNVANSYYNADFYNMIVYGADMYDSELFVNYLVENRQVKNILLNVFPSNGVQYRLERDDLNYRMHEKTTKESKFFFYSHYAFANLNYSFAKIKAVKNDTYLKQPFDAFDERTGAYDKLERDTEYIGDMSEYLTVYPEFVSYIHEFHEMKEIENCMESLKRILSTCEKTGVNLTVMAAPVYYENLKDFPENDVIDFYTALANITPYWDFTMSSISFEPRYFYDASHMRNSIGEMALARINGDDSLYIPDDFGVYVTKDNISEHIKTMFTASSLNVDLYTKQLPILLYHHLTDAKGDDLNISSTRFTEHLDALESAGYSTVFLSDLYDYVRYGKALPENPVVITFDDGYLSNYEYAYPALVERDMKASFFPIGVSIGKDKYKETDNPIIPHYSYEQAKEMLLSGLIEIQSHTYDMHQWAPFEDVSPARETVARFFNESEADYITALRKDSDIWKKTAIAGGLKQSFALAYPQGYSSNLSEAVLFEEGYTVTLSTKPGLCTLICGLPQSLLGLERITVNGALTGEQLISLIDSFR